MLVTGLNHLLSRLISNTRDGSECTSSSCSGDVLLLNFQDFQKPWKFQKLTTIKIQICNNLKTSKKFQKNVILWILFALLMFYFRNHTTWCFTSGPRLLVCVWSFVKPGFTCYIFNNERLWKTSAWLNFAPLTNWWKSWHGSFQLPYFFQDFSQCTPWIFKKLYVLNWSSLASISKELTLMKIPFWKHK